MEHSIQENPVIINEAHCFPANLKLIGKIKQVYALVLLLIFTCFTSEVVEAQTTRVMAPTPGEVKRDASRRTARVEYKQAREKTKETGIFLSADSASLIFPSQATRYQKASYDEAGQVFRVDFEGLEPDSGYFYKIFIRDRQNKVTWSAITAIHTPGFNIRWTGAQKKTIGNAVVEIMLTGESVDTARSHYQVFYNDLPCELLRITSSPESAQSYYVIRLPRISSPGKHKLFLMYKQRKIFEENIETL